MKAAFAALAAALLIPAGLPAASADPCPFALLELRAALAETNDALTPRLVDAVGDALVVCPDVPPTGPYVAPPDAGCAHARIEREGSPLSLTLRAGDVERTFHATAKATVLTRPAGGHDQIGYHARADFGLYADDGGLAGVYLGPHIVPGRGEARGTCDETGALCEAAADAAYLGLFQMHVHGAIPSTCA